MSKNIIRNFKSMVIPYSRPYIVSKREAVKILNSKTDENVINSIKENAKIFEENNQKVKTYTRSNNKKN